MMSATARWPRRSAGRSSEHMRAACYELMATIALSTGLLVLLLGSAITKLGAPLGRGDPLGHYASGFLEWTSTSFGFPFEMTLFPYYPNTDLTQRLLATTLEGLTGNRFLAVNLVWVLSFPLTAAAAWWVLRLAGATGPMAVALALSYTFIPYHIMRGLEHIYLAAMWSVVLAVGLALLVGLGKVHPLMHRRSQYEGGRLRLAALIACCFVVAWSGIYYAFFAILLMAGALLWRTASGARPTQLLRDALPLVVVASAATVVLFGAALANALNPPSATVAERRPSESATYAGNVAFALSPSPLTHVPGVKAAADAFDPYVSDDREGLGYGQFGTLVTTLCALILAVVPVLVRRRRADTTQGSRSAADAAGPRLTGLVVMLLAVALLFFVPQGLNFAFALFVTPGIRSWARLLPVILLLLLVGAVSVVRSSRLVISKIAAWALAAAIIVATVLDGVTPYVPIVGDALRSGERRLDAGVQYAAAVNTAVPRECGVLQLPYVPFPEKGMQIGGMPDYEHFLVSLTNDEKFWSYGGVKYTTASDWAARLSSNLDDTAIRSLSEAGFCGVHVDMRGYSREEAPAVRARIERQLGAAQATGLDGRWLFFALAPTSGPVGDVADRESLTPQTQRFFYPRGT